MNYIFSKNKPEVNDVGYIIGDRFIPINKGNNIKIPEDCAFYMPGDTFYYKSEESLCLTDNPEVGFWSPSSCVGASATYDGVTGLYFGASGTAGRTYIKAEGGGNLFAKDDVTPNEKSGFSARYGAGYPWTYSFWFYPNAETTIGDGQLFMLGANTGQSGSQRRLRVLYQDTTGTFKIVSKDSSGTEANSEWCGSAKKQRWCHVCVTADETAHTFTLYINGVFAASITHSTNIPQLSYRDPNLTLGALESRWDNCHAAIGCQSKMRWYNRVLNEDEIYALTKMNLY